MYILTSFYKPELSILYMNTRISITTFYNLKRCLPPYIILLIIFFRLFNFFTSIYFICHLSRCLWNLACWWHHINSDDIKITYNQYCCSSKMAAVIKCRITNFCTTHPIWVSKETAWFVKFNPPWRNI